MVTITKQDTPTPGPEATGLEALAQEAESLDRTDEGGDAGQVQQPEPAKLSNADILAGALNAGRDVFCAFTGFNSPKATMGPQQVHVISTAWAAVLDKRGIDLAAIMGDYGAEIAAVVATAPVAIALRAGVMEEMRARDVKLANNRDASREIPPAPKPTAVAAPPAPPAAEGVINPTWPE